MEYITDAQNGKILALFAFLGSGRYKKITRTFFPGITWDTVSTDRHENGHIGDAIFSNRHKWGRVSQTTKSKYFSDVASSLGAGFAAGVDIVSMQN